MIRILIIALGGIVVYASAGNGEWGPAIVAIVIVALLLFAGMVERRDTKAWSNWSKYWASGGPDRPRRPQDRTTQRPQSRGNTRRR